MTTVEQFDLARDQAEAFAASSSWLGDLRNLERHLRDVDARLAHPLPLEARLALARDYALTSALLAYARDVAPFVRTGALA